MRHGRHAAWVMALLIAPHVLGEPAVQVGSATFDVEYAVNDDALPLDVVTLWHTTDGGSSWAEYGVDPDQRSPMSFRASREGQHGFYFVFQNASGASGRAPQAGTTPQLSVFVDDTSPAVELYATRQVAMLGNRTLQIRWTATDLNFGDNPVRLDYRPLPDRPWASVGDGPMPNTGWHDWQIPDGLSGPVAIRLSAVDRSGRRTTAGPHTVDIRNSVEGDRPIAQMLVAQRSGAPKPAASVLSSTTEEHAQRLMAQALAYRGRGQYPEAISRLREAVRLNPRWSEAFVEMGEMLYRIGDVDSSLDAYELALHEKPLSRRALRGAAVVHRRRNDHESAGRLLRAILQANPNDAEVWINLGDISVFQGDEVMARECYTRASLVDPAATQIVGDARRRLELMSTVSRTYATDRG